MAKYVTFPHQGSHWSEVKSILGAIVTSPPFSGRELVDKLKPLVKILHKDVDTTVFNGLKNYLKEAPWQKREVYFSKCFPTLVQYALDIERHAPHTGLKFAVQNVESQTVISRKLAASIVACSFLCLWSGRKYDRRSPLNGINFFEFFRTCGTNPGQAGKLECILHYFEVLSEEGEPAGDVIFHRQMLHQSERLTIRQWEKSTVHLCPCEVHITACIEDAGPKVLQVDFANRKIGGGVLGNGKVQEEIRFSLCPELISGLLFMEAMTESEAIVMHGFQNYSHYTGYRDGFRYTGPCQDKARRDFQGNLENYMVAIDALPFKGRLGGPEAQYQPQHLRRELSKSYIGFRQDFLVSSPDPLQGEYTPATRTTEERQMQGIVESYFSSLSETILTRALQESLVSLKDEASQSSSPATSHSSGQNGRTLPEHADMVGATLDYARRRSSNLSDSSSRRSSCTTGSRRSSGNQLTSSDCSELEEYYQAYQARHNLKPSVIKEEIGDTSETTAEVQQLADQVIKSIFTPTVLALEGPTEPNVKKFSEEQPKVPIVKPKARMLSHKSKELSSQLGSRKKSPGRQRNQSSSELASKHKEHRLQREDNKSFDSADSIETTPHVTGIASRDQQRSVKKDNRVEFKPSHLTFKPPQGKSQTKASESPLKSSSSSETQAESLDMDVVNRPPLESPAVPDHMFSYSGYLTDCIMDHAWRELYEFYVGERYRSDSYSSSKHSEKGQMEGFIGGIVDNVWNYSAYNIRKHYKTKQEQQQMWTSDSDIDLDLDLYIYADDFVQGVLTDAVGVYKTQKKEELKKVEAMWQKAQEKFETDAKYFNAEFSRYWKEVHSRQSSRTYKQSRIQFEMQRRRSLDETGRSYRQRIASHFHGPTLSNFEHQLLKSAGEDKLLQQSMSSFEQELLNVNTSLGHDFAAYPALRRASEPVTTRRASFDVAHLCPSEHRRGSSVGSTSSREMILDWLNQSQRSSSSSGNGRRRRQRTRTTSSHLDWYAQDLLLEAFNDALKDLFGDVHSAMLVSGPTGGGDIDSINNSFSSSQSNDQICDTYIAIPMCAQGSKSVTVAGNLGSQLFPKSKHSVTGAGAKEPLTEQINEGERLFSEESVQLSSSPIEGFSHTDASQQIKGTKPKHIGDNNEMYNTNRTEPTDRKLHASSGQLMDHKSSSKSSVVSVLTSEGKSNLNDVGRKPKIESNQNSGQSEASTHHQPQAVRMPSQQSLAERVSEDSTVCLSRDRDPLGSSTRNREIGQRSHQGHSEHVESMVEHMMEGMCENLSNEVLEGAVHTLHSSQPRPGEASTDVGVETTVAAAVGSTSAGRVRQLPIATGNWGCGAFRGDAQLKALIQWIAASQRGAPLYMYYTFSDRQVVKLAQIVQLIQEKGLNVGELMSLIRQFCDLKEANQMTKSSLFEYIEKSL